MGTKGKKNVCEDCGRNYAIFPLVQCIQEPYGEEICRETCPSYMTKEDWAKRVIAFEIAHAKRQLLRRRRKRIAAREIRWAKHKYKDKFSLCKCCSSNSAEFPFVCCMVHPFGEIEFEDKCRDYMSHCDHELFLAYLLANHNELKKAHTPGIRMPWPQEAGELIVSFTFPCGTTRQCTWLPGMVKAPFGFVKCDHKRAVHAEILGKAPLDINAVFECYKFVDYALHPIDRKILMNTAVDEIFKVQAKKEGTQWPL